MKLLYVYSVISKTINIYFKPLSVLHKGQATEKNPVKPCKKCKKGYNLRMEGYWVTSGPQMWASSGPHRPQRIDTSATQIKAMASSNI